MKKLDNDPHQRYTYPGENGIFVIKSTHELLYRTVCNKCVQCLARPVDQYASHSFGKLVERMPIVKRDIFDKQYVPTVYIFIIDFVFGF